MTDIYGFLAYGDTAADPNYATLEDFYKIVPKITLEANLEPIEVA